MPVIAGIGSGWNQKPEFCQVGYLGSRYLSYLTCCLLRCISSNLDQKQSSWDSNHCSDMDADNSDGSVTLCTVNAHPIVHSFFYSESKETELHLLIQSLNAHNKWGWVRSNPVAGNLIKFSLIGRVETQLIEIPCAPSQGPLAGSWNLEPYWETNPGHPVWNMGVSTAVLTTRLNTFPYRLFSKWKETSLLCDLISLSGK